MDRLTHRSLPPVKEIVLALMLSSMLLGVQLPRSDTASAYSATAIDTGAAEEPPESASPATRDTSETLKLMKAGAAAFVESVSLPEEETEDGEEYLDLSNAGYLSETEDMLAAEKQYSALETQLQRSLERYAEYHPGYDEYVFDLDDMGHDPYVLVSILSAQRDGAWTIDQVREALVALFDSQYILTETFEEKAVETEEGPEYRLVCTVTLSNALLSHLPAYILSETRLAKYAAYMATLGGRPELFPDSEYIGRYDDGDADYTPSAEALENESFAAMLEKAERCLGYPYVWGGSSPKTSFDCSGFVCWVVNSSGWDLGRLNAQGLYSVCTPVSAEEARPGDLVFFTGTYDTVGASHVGIYAGEGMMLHCGDPIGYASLDSDYWRSHFYSYARLPAAD